jgi:hypothetical protein
MTNPLRDLLQQTGGEDENPLRALLRGVEQPAPEDRPSLLQRVGGLAERGLAAATRTGGLPVTPQQGLSAAAGAGIAAETTKSGLEKLAERFTETPGVALPGARLGAELVRGAGGIIDRLRGATSAEALPQLAEVAGREPIAGFAGELTGTLAQIGLTPLGATRLPVVLSGIVRSIPVSALQSLGSGEFGSGVQGVSNLLEQFGGEEGARLAGELEPILSDPAKRVAADAAFDALLGTAVEGLGAGARALKTATSAVGEAPVSIRGQLPPAQRRLPPAREVPVEERIRPEGAAPIETGPVRPIPQPGVPEVPAERLLPRRTRGQRAIDAATAVGRQRAERANPLRRILIPEDVELPRGAPEVLGGTRRELLQREALERAGAGEELAQAGAAARAAREGPRVAPAVREIPQLQAGAVGPAAVRDKVSGRTFTGRTHAEAQQRAIASGELRDVGDIGISKHPDLDDGFENRVTGEFITRRRAEEIGIRSGQIEREARGSLISEELERGPVFRRLSDPSPTDVDDAVVKAHNEFDGSTFDPRTGENQVGKDLWAVSPFPDRSISLDAAPDAELMAQFRALNADLLEEPKNFVGTWLNKKTGKHILNVVRLDPSKDAAIRVGREAGEDAIFNLKSFEEFNLKTGEAGAARSEIAQALAGAGVGAAVGGAVAGEEGALAGLAIGAAAGSAPALRRLGEAGAVRLTKGDPALKVTAELFRQGNPLTEAKFKRIAKKIGVAPDKKTYDRAVQLWFDLSTSTVNGIASFKELDRLAKTGLAGAQWYDDALSSARRHFGKQDGEMFLKFFAVTSQNTAFKVAPQKADNLTLALKAFREWKEGVPFGSKFNYTVAHKQIVKNLDQVAAGKAPSGPKIGPFMDALLGDKDAVVVDRWMNRAFGFATDTPTVNQRKFIEEIVREDAQRYGLTPRQYQAAIWEGALRRAGRVPPLPKGVKRAFPSDALKFRINRAGGFAQWLAGEGGQVGREVLQAIAGAGAGAAVGAAVAEEPLAGVAGGAVAGAAAGIGARPLLRGARAVGAPPTRAAAAPAAPGARATDAIGRRPGVSRVKFDKFGMGRQAQAAIEAEAENLVRTGEVKFRRVSQEETLRVARQLGFERIRSRPTDSVSLTAARSLINKNSDDLLRLHGQMEEILERGGRKADLNRIEAEIASLEGQQTELTKIFMQGARETGRALASLRIQATRSLSTESAPFWRNKLSRIARRNLTVEELAELDRTLRRQDRDSLLKIAERLAPPKGLGETLLAMRRAGLLTGIRTQIRNATSNLSELLFRQADEPLAVAADAIFSSITGRARTRAFVNPARRFAASARGSRKGISLMGEILAGRRTLDPGEARKFELTESMLRKNMFLDGYIKWVHRAQGAVDKPWKMAAMMESLVEQARWSRKFAGIKESEDVLVRRAMESFEKGAPNDMALQAIADAEIATFQNSSVIGRFLSRAGENLKAEAVRGRTGAGVASAIFEFVVPFKNTPGAVFGRLVERTGLGAISGLSDLWRIAKSTDMDDEAVRLLQRQATGRLARGTSGIVAVYVGYQLGVQDIISGAWPSDSKDRERWVQQGKTSDAIRLKDGKWYKLNGISPIGNLLAIGASMYHAFQDPQYTPSEAAAGFVQQTGSTFLDQSFMRGVQDFQNFFDPQRGGLGGRAARSAIGSWVPIAVSDFSRMMDHTEREIQDPRDELVARTPYYSVTLPARVGRTGRPLRETTRERAARLISPGFTPVKEQETPGLAEANRVGAVIPRISRRTKDEPPEETRRRQTVIGQERDKAIQELAKSRIYQRLPQEAQRDAIEDLMRDVSREVTRRGLSPLGPRLRPLAIKAAQRNTPAARRIRERRARARRAP